MSRPQCTDWTTLPTNAFHGDAQDAPCLTYPTVYVLRLEHGKFYIGLATAGCGVEQRWAKHIAGNGAQFVKVHKPIDVIDIYYPASKSIQACAGSEVFGSRRSDFMHAAVGVAWSMRTCPASQLQGTASHRLFVSVSSRER